MRRTVQFVAVLLSAVALAGGVSYLLNKIGY
jgi:hypothetical protein